MKDKDQTRVAFRTKVQDMKHGIARMLEPHGLAGQN